MDTSYSSAFKEVRLQEVRELLRSWGLPCSRAEAYVFLRDAAENEHTFTELLLQTSIKHVVNIQLHFAVESGEIEIVQMLLDKGANIDENWYGKTPLHNAIENEKMEVIELLLKHGAYVNARDNKSRSPLHVAVMKGCLQIVEHLLKYGANVNCACTSREGFTPLHFAVTNGDIEIVEMLLDKGAHINAKTYYGNNPLHNAIETDHWVRVPEVTECVLIKGEKNNGEIVKIVKLLLSRGANINAQNIWDDTPLHVAAREGYLEIVKILLKFGANIHSRDDHGRTALYYAVRDGHLEIVEILLKFGADVDSRAGCGRTVFRDAARDGRLEIVEILLKFGADVDSRDEFGRTALHFACLNGHEKIVVALLEYGSDINIVSITNHTSLDFAMNGISALMARGIYFRVEKYEKLFKEILKWQIIKMKTANLDVSRESLLSISSNDGISNFLNECEEEMESIKSEKISNSNVSFHDILTKNIHQLAIYARNENIVQVLKSDDYKSKFPIYASMINSRFRKGVERKELLEQGNRFFHSLFNRLPQLPYNCTEKIFSYLSDKDLRFLKDVCEHIQYS